MASRVSGCRRGAGSGLTASGAGGMGGPRSRSAGPPRLWFFTDLYRCRSDPGGGAVAVGLAGVVLRHDMSPIGP